MTLTCINPDDKGIWPHHFHVQIGIHDSINVSVYANCAQAALDAVIDHEVCKPFIMAPSEVDAMAPEEQDETVSGGNCGEFIRFGTDELRIETL